MKSRQAYRLTTSLASVFAMAGLSALGLSKPKPKKHRKIRRRSPEGLHPTKGWGWPSRRGKRSNS